MERQPSKTTANNRYNDMFLQGLFIIHIPFTIYLTMGYVLEPGQKCS